jgi:TetR/AcrR family fatty acid metabolism transcriptional regulator
MAPKIVDKKAKRRLIEKAALKVFAQTGLAGFKMAEIAVAAGVGKGTLYEYFPSKDDLIIGCFEEFMVEFDEHGRAAIEGLSDPTEMIRKLIAASFEFCLADRALLDTLFDFYAAGIPRRNGRSLLPQLAPMYRQMIKQVATIVDAGIAQNQFRATDSRAAASMILALIDGVTFQIALRATEADAELLSKQTSEMVLNGLVTSPPQAVGHQDNDRTT